MPVARRVRSANVVALELRLEANSEGPQMGSQPRSESSRVSCESYCWSGAHARPGTVVPIPGRESMKAIRMG